MGTFLFMLTEMCLNFDIAKFLFYSYHYIVIHYEQIAIIDERVIVSIT